MIKTYLESLNNQTEENKNPVLTKNDDHNFGVIDTPVVLIQQILALIPDIFDCVVDKEENCYPMIPSGKAHNQMLLGKKDEDDEISDEGKVLV